MKQTWRWFGPDDPVKLAHVRQAMRWGIFFPFVYLASSAWAALRGRDAYWHNKFEIDAREEEKHL